MVPPSLAVVPLIPVAPVTVPSRTASSFTAGIIKREVRCAVLKLAERERTSKHRLGRVFRLRTVRVAGGVVLVFAVWVAFSIGQALLAPNGGSVSSKLSEWARDHYLGPVVTFGEWLTYNPPKVGGKPSFSLAVPSAGPAQYARVRGFQPIIPQRLNSPAGAPLPGEGVWRVLETVNSEPAIFGTFL